MERIKMMLKNNSRQAKGIRAGFIIDMEPMKLCLDNMSGVVDKDVHSDLVLNVREDKLIMRMETKHGATVDNFTIENKGEAKASLKLEPKVTRDTLDRLEGKVEMRFHGDNFCLFEKQSTKMVQKYLVVGVHNKK